MLTVQSASAQSLPPIAPPTTGDQPLVKRYGREPVAPAVQTQDSGIPFTPPVVPPSFTSTAPALPQIQPPAPAVTPSRVTASEDLRDYRLSEVPGLERLTRFESEKSLFLRMQQEKRRSDDRVVFPSEPVLARDMYKGRHFKQMVEVAQPYYVGYKRLLFEQKNFERHGWDLGPITPLVSAGRFYWDVATLPYHMATRPCQQFEYNSGECLPGDPVPFLLYPPELSVTGLTAQTTVLGGLLFAFP